MSIRVTYLYSACVRIDTPDVRVLCDPWFTEGAYDGSWYQFPRLLAPLQKVGEADLVYVSHIHPDHYDPAFLHQYLARHPGAKLAIADFQHNHLLEKMRRDGFDPLVASRIDRGHTQLHLVPNEHPSEADPNDVDSALVVRHGLHGVVNMNDNALNREHVARIRELCPNPDIALLGYTGAGSYPQTYYDDPKRLRGLADAKKRQFFERYRQMRDALAPKLAIPFASKYVLAGKLADLNDYRGVADAVEVLQFDPAAVVLDDGGDACVDTATLKPTRTRRTPYRAAEVEERLAHLRDVPMTYEQYFDRSSIAALPIGTLSPKAYANALARSSCDTDYFFCLSVNDAWFVLNANRFNPRHEVCRDPSLYTPRSEVSLDPRYLFGLLTGVFHWHNAEIGSHLCVRRIPDTYNRTAQRFLNFYQV